MDALIEQLILLKTLAIISSIGTLVLTLFLLLSCNRFRWQGSNIRLIGFFYEASMKDTITLAVCMLKFYLVLSLLFTGGRIELIHIFFFGFLVLIYNLCRLNLKDMGVSIFNGVVIMGVLYVANFLLVYLREVLFDGKIAAALVFLAIFLILYAAYDIVCCILTVVSSRKKRKENGVNRNEA